MQIPFEIIHFTIPHSIAQLLGTTVQFATFNDPQNLTYQQKQKLNLELIEKKKMEVNSKQKKGWKIHSKIS